MGFIEALTLAFIVLKLAHVIDWSWWAVLSPELIAIAVYLFVAVVFGASALLLSKNRR